MITLTMIGRVGLRGGSRRGGTEGDWPPPGPALVSLVLIRRPVMRVVLRDVAGEAAEPRMRQG